MTKIIHRRSGGGLAAARSNPDECIRPVCVAFFFIFKNDHGIITMVMSAHQHIVAAGEFKAKCLGLLEKVHRGRQSYVITKHGKPVAQLVPVKDVEISNRKRLRSSVIFEGDVVSPLDVEWELQK